jgi:multidrug efflux pump subunit AcrA (membrane-fusion protein)
VVVRFALFPLGGGSPVRNRRTGIGNPDRLLKPEMYESLKISVPGKHLLAIPRSALMRDGDGTVVFVGAGQRPDGTLVFKRRTVIANEASEGDLVPVLDGLKAGEQLVVEHAVLLLGML